MLEKLYTLHQAVSLYPTQYLVLVMQ